MFNNMEFSFQNYDFLKDFEFEQLNSFQLKTCYYAYKVQSLSDLIIIYDLSHG